MGHAIEVEIERNHASFLDLLDELLPEKAGQYALLHNQKLVGVYPSPADAERQGYARFQDMPYSIQLVSREPIDLGFYSYAIPAGTASE